MPSKKPYDEYREQGLAQPIRLPAPLVTFWLLSLAAAAFSVLGVVAILFCEDPTERLVGALALVFFGGGAAVVFPPFLKPGHVAVFDNEGFYTRRYDVKIRWEHVRAVGIVSASNTESLCVAVDDYTVYRPGVPWRAAWLRVLYRSQPGRLGSVALIAALEPSEAREAWEVLSKTKAFDFIWSSFEFPSITVSEVRDLVENESRRARERLALPPQARVGGPGRRKAG